MIPAAVRRLGLAGLLIASVFLLGGSAHQATAQHRVTVTAYASGTVTASGIRPRVGIIALSRDLEQALVARFGDHIHLQGMGTYVFQDRMPWYWKRRVDLYMHSMTAARQFGKRTALLTKVTFSSSPP